MRGRFPRKQEASAPPRAPFWQDGYFTIQDKPGYGIELNPDVAKAHLAPGETWWG